MLKQNPEHIKGVLARADMLHSPERVQQACADLAVAVGQVLADADPLVLCVMNGALFTTSMLITRLNFPLRIGYLHATRYQGTTSGGELTWLADSRWPLACEHVLVVDDIFDAGITLEMIVQHCHAAGAKTVHSAVLAEKIRPRDCTYRPDFIGLTVEDRYVFGAGMDYKEYLRNLPCIYAVADSDL